LDHPLESATVKDHGPVRSLDVMVSILLFWREKADINFREFTNISYFEMHLFI